MGCSTRRRYPPHTWRRQPPPTKAALGAALARFDNRPCVQHTSPYLHTTSAAAAQEVQAIPRTDNDIRRTNSAKPAPPNLHLPSPRQGSLNRRFEWFSLVTFFLQKKKVTRAGARNAPSRARRRNTCSPPGQRPPRKRKKRDGLRRLFLYLISCPCGSATPAPAPARISASCFPPPACRSGCPARSTSRTQTWPR